MQYSIADLEKLSGIKAHTIRIWEQRYGLLKPKRTDTNIRFYDDEQLKRLLNVRTLVQNGLKISQISKFSAEEIHEHLDQISSFPSKSPNAYEPIIDRLILAGMKFDGMEFERAFSYCILHYGMQTTFIKILYPMFSRVGLLWNKDKLNPAQEHFITNLISLKLHTAIDGLPPGESGDVWLLFLNEREEHEIGLLFAHYLLRLHGKSVIYLGAKVPFSNLVEATKIAKPGHLLTFFNGYSSGEIVTDWLAQFRKKLKQEKLFVSGRLDLFRSIKLPANITLLKDADHLTSLAKAEER